MADGSFFEESTEQSLVKAQIVYKYFWSWAKVIVGVQKKQFGQSGGKIAYIDLFAGPGRYKDGTVSTPLLVLQKAIDDPDLRDRLVMILNDKDENSTRSLQTEVSKFPGVELLKYKPQIYNEEVGDRIVKEFSQTHLVPTLFFVDPWGYKGLSLKLVNSVLKGWGCDCIFFFNYNRINMGLNNMVVETHMNALFGKKRADNLRQRLWDLSPDQRELAIIEELCSALQEMGRRFVLPFCFKNERGTRTSHHLIFVSKHFRGYEIMKNIMAGESSKLEQGVASFAYCPADSMYPTLFALARPLDDLADMLLRDFAGKTIRMKEVYERHNVGKPYIAKNYKDALLKLEAEARITCDPPAEHRRKQTFGDEVLVRFPPRDSL